MNETTSNPDVLDRTISFLKWVPVIVVVGGVLSWLFDVSDFSWALVLGGAAGAFIAAWAGGLLVGATVLLGASYFLSNWPQRTPLAFVVAAPLTAIVMVIISVASLVADHDQFGIGMSLGLLLGGAALVWIALILVPGVFDLLADLALTRFGVRLPPPRATPTRSIRRTSRPPTW